MSAHRTVVLVACFLAFFLSPQAVTADADFDGMDDALEEELAVRYVPHYIFHPEERYFYIDPGLFLNSTGQQLNDVFAPHNEGQRPFGEDDSWAIAVLKEKIDVINPFLWYQTAPDPANFASYIGSARRWYSNSVLPDLVTAYLNVTDWSYLRILPPGWSSVDWNSLDYSCNQDVPVSYLVEENSEGNIELQYWQFSYNDNKEAILGIGNHLCDWSHVTIVFQKQGDGVVEPPLYAYYSAHRSVYRSEADSPFQPRYLLWSDISRDGLTHPRVLVSKNDHELYFETPKLSWNGGDFYEERGLPYEETECFCKPFFIQDHVKMDWYDEVGVGQILYPTNLKPLGNGDNPHPDAPWLTFGGKWANGPEGPLGTGGYVRFREHNLARDPDGPATCGSVKLTYDYLKRNGLHEWQKFCICSGLYTCDDEIFDVAYSILRPLGFDNTATAFENGCFGQESFDYSIRVSFSVKTANGGPHNDLTPANSITLFYRYTEESEWKQYELYDDMSLQMYLKPGAEYYVPEFSTASGPDHYWKIYGQKSGIIEYECLYAGIQPDRSKEITFNAVEFIRKPILLKAHPVHSEPGNVTISYWPDVSIGGIFGERDLLLPFDETSMLEVPSGSIYNVDPYEFGTGVGSPERWSLKDSRDHTFGRLVGTDTLYLDFYHQFLTNVQLVGCFDYALSTNITQHVQYGDTSQLYHVYDRWIDWSDDGNWLIFDSCLTFYPGFCASSATSVFVSSPTDCEIDYSNNKGLDFRVIEVTDDDVDQSGLAISVDKLVWEEVTDESESEIWQYDAALDSTMLLSSDPACHEYNYGPAIEGDLTAWISGWTRSGLGDIVVRRGHDGTCQVIGTTAQNLTSPVSISGNRIAWRGEFLSGYGDARVYDIDSLDYVFESDATSAIRGIILSGNNIIYRKARYYNQYFNWSYGITGSFYPLLGGLYRSVTGVLTNYLDSAFFRFAVPSMSGYDVGYITQQWHQEYPVVEYFDGTTVEQSNGGIYGLHYTLKTHMDYNYPWAVPQVSGGYLSVGYGDDQNGDGFMEGELSYVEYLCLDSVKAACPFSYCCFNDSCYRSIGELWKRLYCNEYRMSGNNFCAVGDGGSEGEEVFFLHGLSNAKTVLSSTYGEMKSPRISGFNAAWLENDGNDWEVHMAIGAPQPESLTTSQVPDNGSTCHVDRMVGWGFQDGIRVFLSNGLGQERSFGEYQSAKSSQDGHINNLVEASNVKLVVSPDGTSELTCDIDLTGCTAGAWAALVLNPDGQIGANPNTIIEVVPEEPPEKCTINYPPPGATNVSAYMMTFYWQEAARADSYYVHIGVDTDSLMPVYGGEVTAYTPPSLDNQTTYYYRVDSKDFGGVTLGDLNFFTTAAAVPEPVSNPDPPVGSAGVNVSSAFSWGDAERADSFKVVIAEAFSAGRIEMVTTDTSVHISGLEPHTKYLWTVEALNASGGALSPTWWFTTEPSSAPLSPTNSSPESGEDEVANLLVLSWSDCYQADYYGIALGLNNPPSDFSYTFENVYEVEALLPEMTYYWQVIAFNSLGSSPGPVWSFSTGSFDAPACCIGTKGSLALVPSCDSPDQEVNITDLQLFIDHMYMSLTPLCCEDEADLDASGTVDITDLQLMIDYQFITLDPFPPCP